MDGRRVPPGASTHTATGDRGAAGEPRWPRHLNLGALRWVRSSRHYDDTVTFYRDVVGLPVVGSFSGSYGEDGTIFGLPGTATQMEIVRTTGSMRSPDGFDQIVFYLPGVEAVAAAVEPLRRTGAEPDPAAHPYWLARGAVVFLDPDGRGVVYAPWIYGSDPEPVDPADPVEPEDDDRTLG
jgi:catechol 2,3-dioxygenase-like lactoylglutathione lyase family enzyme